MTRPNPDKYTADFVRFVRVPWHAEAYIAAYLDQSGASTHELERLYQERKNKPSDHDCTCRCPQEPRGYPPCHECKRIRAEQTGVCSDCLTLPAAERPRRCYRCARLEAGAEAIGLGRSGVPDSVVPLVIMLDLQRALAVLGKHSPAGRVARYMNGDIEAA